MKSLGLWLYFIATITLSGVVNAEYVDNLPPIPYQLSPLIKGAMANLSPTQFAKAIESDTEKQTEAIIRGRGGKEGREFWDVFIKCTNKNIPMTDERATRCHELAFDTMEIFPTIFFLDYDRAVFKLAGYSFDKSIVAFANDCNTLGSCEIVMQKISELTNSMEFGTMIYLFGTACAVNSPDIRERFLPSNIAAACTQIYTSKPFKAEVCKINEKWRSSFCNNLHAGVIKSKKCSETRSHHYPEIDCN